MELLVRPDADAVAVLAAERIAARLRAAPGLVLGLATGRTMEGIYARLARLHREQGLTFAGCSTFNLDEYLGLAPDDPNSYRRYMNHHLFGLIDIDIARTHVPHGLAPDARAEAERYEARIRAAGGIDLQLLGIGENGHVGFNEPMASFASRTRSVELTPETRRQNEAMFGGAIDRVPAQAVTMGIGTILEAREVLLVATGAAKAAVLADAIAGRVTPAVPASALQHHARCCVIADAAAASRLPAALRGSDRA